MSSDEKDAFAALVRERTAAAFGFWWNEGLHFHEQDAPRRVTRRCPLCNPASWTRRLCIDGREYRRRQMARKRRAKR